MRLIDADALKKVIEHYQNKRYRNREEDFAIRDAFKRAMIIIDDAPTVAERTQGKWVEKTNENLGKCLKHLIECSVCGSAFCYEDLLRRSYCPNCGADMRIKTPCNNCIDDSDCDSCSARMR